MTNDALSLIYFAVDASGSMNIGRKANNIATTILPAMIEELASLTRTRYGVVTFRSAVTVVKPIAEPWDGLPLSFAGEGTTSYTHVFRGLREIVATDVQTLTDAGHQLHRPAIFFLSDGEPGDVTAERDAAWLELTAEADPLSPNVIAVGVGSARFDTLLRYGSTGRVKNRDKETEKMSRRPRTAFQVSDGPEAAKVVNRMLALLASNDRLDSI